MMEIKKHVIVRPKMQQMTKGFSYKAKYQLFRISKSTSGQQI